ncbi:hypothetical protein Cni_G04671 [Canna indica]|uniref:Transposase MuDR plant domain-containing protein n=1 Tax=Canna indica TaxID=4628 RepID=A0AAQ3Q4Q4_9LILI|nr:hypothetical protein Cni_G04671 [Canna indica]
MRRVDEYDLTLYAPKITEHVKLKTKANRIASRVKVIVDVGREEVLVDVGREGVIVDDIQREDATDRESVERDAWVGIEVATDCESDDDNDDVPNAEEYDFDVGWQEEIDGIKNEKRRVITDNLEDFKTLYKGQIFPDLKVAKQYVNFFALANGYGLRVQKSDTGRVRYKCDVGCPFVCRISKDGDNPGFKIKTLNSNHNCNKSYENPRANYLTLAHYFKNRVQNNPQYKVKVMRKDLSSGLQLNIKYEKMKRAKRTILTQLEGSFKDDYNKIIAYAQELRESNPGTDVVVNISRDALREGRKRFLRMYTYFHALKMGWKQSLRPFIGMDIGQDSMRQFYPIAWAVVDKETKSTWTWFVQCLKSSLDLKIGKIHFYI